MGTRPRTTERWPREKQQVLGPYDVLVAGGGDPQDKNCEEKNRRCRSSLLAKQEASLGEDALIQALQPGRLGGRLRSRPVAERLPWTNLVFRRRAPGEPCSEPVQRAVSPQLGSRWHNGTPLRPSRRRRSSGPDRHCPQRLANRRTPSGERSSSKRTHLPPLPRELAVAAKQRVSRAAARALPPPEPGRCVGRQLRSPWAWRRRSGRPGGSGRKSER